MSMLKQLSFAHHFVYDRSNFGAFKPISTHMTCSQKYLKILCAFEFTNIAKEDYYLLKRNTPLEGLASNFLSVKTSGGQALSYEGVHIRRAPVSIRSFIRIGAGETLTMPAIDLTEAYTFPYDGKYTVSYVRPLVYKTVEEMASFQYMHKSNEREHLIAQVAYAVVEVSESFSLQGPRYKEFMTLHNRENSLGSIMDDCPDADFANDVQDQQKATQSIHKGLCDGLAKALAAVDSNDDLFKTWFDKDGKHKDKAKDVYQKVSTGLTSGKTVKYEFMGDGGYCKIKEGVWGYSWYIGIKPDPKVYLCTHYYSGSSREKMLTLVHEWTHVFGNTHDHGDSGSEEYCKGLAKNDPAKAIDNAENYAYFYDKAQ